MIKRQQGTPLITVVSTVLLAVLAFFAREALVDMKATASELQRHEQEDVKNWTVASQINTAQDAKFDEMTKRLEGIDRKLDRLLGLPGK